jgi:hypothetical protein
MTYTLHDKSLTQMHSTQQDPDRSARRPAAAYQTDELEQCRGAMQCCRLHHKLGHTRRQQGKDCSFRRSGSFDETGKVQGHACPTERYWRSVEHDPFRYAAAIRSPDNSL